MRQERAEVDGTRYYHLILLAENETGYRNLVELISLANIEGYYYKPRIDKELLRQYHEGIIALSACVAGEIPQAILRGNNERAEALIAEYVEIFGQDNFFLEIQDHGLPEEKTVNRALREFAKKYDIPLHIGVTEAGPLITGIVKSTLAFGALLSKGIGDTIRVSLSSSPENEVIAGREILVECGKREGGVKLISCPRCGRIGFDVHAFVEKWQRELLSLDKNISIAVMGCVVNGPGEGKHADLGIAGSGNKVVIFKKGKIVRTVDAKDADKVFREELNTL